MKTAIFFGLTLLCLAESTSAQNLRGGAADPAELFEKADANHDGVVSREEFLSARAAKFDQLDRNHDGYLTDDDFPRFALRGDRGDKVRAMLRRADADHDGKVSREEFQNSGAAMFGLVDANHDGIVDAGELKRASERLKAMREQ